MGTTQKSVIALKQNSAITIVPSKRDPLKQPSFDEKLQRFFEAMVKGQTIKSVTCFRGHLFRNHREEDFTLKDFTIVAYLIAASAVYNKQHDMVITNKAGDGNRGTFFMPWVLGFELYEESLN